MIFMIKMMIMIVFFLCFTLTLSLPQESLLLHRARLSLDDPDGFFATWPPLTLTLSSSSLSPCSWAGIHCDPATASVTGIDFSNANLAGLFPLSLCQLPSLTSLSLSNNNINATLPPEISTCHNLTHLDLSENLLTGDLPGSLADLPALSYLDLSGNNFSGEVPASFGTFRELRQVSLVSNLLDGDFPFLFGNVSTLRELNLTDNPFRPSRLGYGIGNFTSLEVLWAQSCNLMGEIPESLGRLSQLVVLDLSDNRLTGSIPSSLTELTRVVQIELYNNSLTGELPTGWSGLTKLRRFDASMNQLKGTIPDELTRLPLSSLNLFDNEFEGGIPESIADSPNLYELKLFENRLSGELTHKLGENSPLTILDVSNNLLSGEIPSNLCSKGQLEELLLSHNSFTGQLGPSLSGCRSLLRVRLGYNKLSGNVPAGFWGLPHVSLLELSENSFSGEISGLIGSGTNLSEVDISGNNFTGTLPEEVGLLTNLVSFVARGNKFSGPLPESIFKLSELGRLILNDNNFSGEIPNEISSMKRLNDLSLANNQFSGKIPADIGSLSGLNYLDLSRNRFSGEVPYELQNLKINQLNLSNNCLTGKIPPSFDKGIYKNSFLGNPGLCGKISDRCGSRVEVKNQGYQWLIRLIFVLAGIIFILGIYGFYFKYKSFKESKRSIDKSKWSLTSFHKLGFNEYEILGCLSEDNVIGSGGSGKVYKGVLSNGEIVAVKKLWCKKGNNVGNDVEKGSCEDDDGFEAEVETLGKIRHKNIVRLWCCCKSGDCKFLVYEYMEKGSVGDLLHTPKGGILLDWGIRFKIALDSAEGLSYLHHDCVPPIVHRDVKSNNILLDGDFGAKVADFGVAKTVEASGKVVKSMSVIAGSCGYIAPEYAYTLRVNEKSDIYSFGVVILELVTGKRPVDPKYGEKDLVKWVCTTMDQKGVDHVLDPNLDPCFKEEICKVLNIGLICTSSLPINRPTMRRVVKMLLEAGGENQSKSGKRDGRLTPYYPEDASDQGSVA